jgi:hypothetical protein
VEVAFQRFIPPDIGYPDVVSIILCIEVRVFVNLIVLNLGDTVGKQAKKQASENERKNFTVHMFSYAIY